MKNFKNLMQIITEKMRKNPKEEFARLKFRHDTVEKQIPDMTPEEEKLANITDPSRLSGEDKKNYRLAKRKLYKIDSLSGQLSNIRSAMRSQKEKISES